MCGILLVQSRSHMPLAQHQAALAILQRRGPDRVTYQWITESTFVAQTVLHVTGTDEFYNQTRSDAFAYNGEIYDYRSHGHYHNDIELVYHTVRTDPAQLAKFLGTWAWVWADCNQLLWASDPQGEKCLYQYQNQDLLVVSSDVAAVLTYVTAQSRPIPYANKGWSMIDSTPWQGIQRCEPGRLYRNGVPQHHIDSVWQWIDPCAVTDLHQITQQFEHIWHSNIDSMTPNEPASLSFSGGLDSSLILASMPDLSPVTVDCVGKDSIVTDLTTPKISVGASAWADHYRELIHATKMPAQSWSHVGKWLVAKHCADRVIFTGLGADELFGGYAHHPSLSARSKYSQSPYCENDHNDLWQQCLSAYDGDARQAILLMDYWYQVVGVDAPGLDRLGGYWGKETRNPFMMQNMIKFALNLPWTAKVDSVGKLPIRSLYEKITGHCYDLPKKGFAGHANDALPWLGIEIMTTGDRHRDWQQIATKSFYSWCDGK